MEANFDKALVMSENGLLQGTVEQGLKVFRGIPYAMAPVGERRFKAPQPHGNWRGIRSTKHFGPSCVQDTGNFDEQRMPIYSQYEEDCLYLNIWTNAVEQNEKRPVFVWVHGGGMTAGSGSEPMVWGENLTRSTGAVTVSINYRLNVFSFFTTPQLDAEGGGKFSGNYGLLDIIEAVKWIKRNIAAFGGDPDNITLAGQSGGAAGNGLLMASPLMKGLIRRMCIDSGPIFWGMMQPAPKEQRQEASLRLMKDLNCHTIEELRRKDAWELFDAACVIGIREFNIFTDGYVVPRNVHEMYENGNFNNFDLMIGSCSQEIPAARGKGVTREQFETYLNHCFPGHVEDMIRWYGAEDLTDYEKICSTINSDLMAVGAVKMGQLCAKRGQTCYVWLNTKETEDARGAKMGCPHCGEMPYLFGKINCGGAQPYDPYSWNDKDYAFSHLIQGYWYGFMKDGNPNGKGCPEWRKYEKDFDICVLGNETGMLPEDRYARYRFFEELLETHVGEAASVYWYK